MLPAAFINPGDVTLMTVPGYPVAGTYTRYYGGEVHRCRCSSENGFFPDLDGIPADIKQRAKLLVINYPNSPTGAVATRDFYERVIEFAHANQVVVVQDAAHILLTYDGQPLSFLQVDGAKEVGVEVHSMSKGFNMIGWRMGWVCGHPKIVQAFADVKDNSDSGQFMAIQHAAAEALRHAEIPRQVREKYRRRLAKLVAALNRSGSTAKMPGGTYFLYAKAPAAAGEPDVRQRRGGVAVPDLRAVGVLRAVGRRRGVPAVLGDVPGERRGRGGRADGRDGRAAGRLELRF